MKFADVLGNGEVKSTLMQGVRAGRVPHAQFVRQPRGRRQPALGPGVCAVRVLHRQTRRRQLRRVRLLPQDDALSCTPIWHSPFQLPNRKDTSGSELSSKDFYEGFREAVTAKPYLSPVDWFRHAEIDDKVPVINARTANEIIHDMQMKAFESPYKICLIWLPELFFHAAVPKLLKIIEEPPANTLFLLVSNSPGRYHQHHFVAYAARETAEDSRFRHHGRADEPIRRGNATCPRNREHCRRRFQQGQMAHERARQRPVGEHVPRMDVGHLQGRYSRVGEIFRRFPHGNDGSAEEFLVYCLHLFRESIVKVSNAGELARTTSSERVFLDKFAKTINPEAVSGNAPPD